MCQADLSRDRRAATTHHAGIADGMVRGAKGPGGQERLIRLESAQGAVNARGLQAFGRRQGRQDGRQAPRQQASTRS